MRTLYIEEDEVYPLGNFLLKDRDSSEYPDALMSLVLNAAHGIFSSDSPAVSAMCCILYLKEATPVVYWFGRDFAQSRSMYSPFSVPYCAIYMLTITILSMTYIHS